MKLIAVKIMTEVTAEVI